MFFGFLVVLVCFLTNAVVGLNDYFMLGLAIFIAYITQSVIIEFQMGSRHMLADHFKLDSELNQVLRKPGIFAFILSSIAAFILAASFLAFMKGLILQHGFFVISIMLFVSAIIIYKFLSENLESKDAGIDDNPSLEKERLETIIHRNVVTGTSHYANFAFRLVVIGVVLNIVFALLFTAFDTAYFIGADVTLANFDQHVLQKAIGFSEHNTYSRALLNAYLLMDSFKLAIVNSLLDMFMTTTEKLDNFYFFYFFTLLLNIIKLIPFSVSFVFLLKGIRIRSNKYQHYFLLFSHKLAHYTNGFLIRFKQNKTKGN